MVSRLQVTRRDFVRLAAAAAALPGAACPALGDALTPGTSADEQSAGTAGAGEELHPFSLAAYCRSAPDRNWVIPIGAVGHHRTLGVTFAGSISDPPLAIIGMGNANLKDRPWASGTVGVFHEAVGLAVGTPTNFWGADGKLHHSLLDGHLPIVISEGASGDLHLEQTAFASLPQGEMVSHQGDEPILAYVRVHVKNLAETEQESVVWVWRSGPIPHLGEVGGLTRRFEAVNLTGSKVVGDSGNCHLIFFPSGWDLGFEATSDTKDIKYFGRLSTKLGPGETKDFWYLYPFWPLGGDLAEKLSQGTYDEMLPRVVSGWKKLYSQGVSLSLPDERIGPAFDVCFANTLLLSQKLPWGSLIFDSYALDAKQQPIDFAGTIRLGSYNRMCEDSAQKAIVHSLIQTGHFDYAREALEVIFHSQGFAQPRGAFSQKGSLSAGDATALAECGCPCVWMSGTGYTLWATAEYYKYTHDAVWIRSHREQIIDGFNWIKTERRRWDFFPGYQGLMRGMRICDSADAGYGPYNDVMSYWGMKEMIEVFNSLGIEVREWEDELRDYEKTIKTVYERDDLSAYFRMQNDYGLAAGAAFMSGLYPLDTPIGKRMADGSHLGWYGMYHGLARIELGDNDKFLDQYFWLSAHHMSHETFCNGEWPGRDGRDSPIQGPSDFTDAMVIQQPHDHSNAGLHFMTRAMLAYEDRTAIHLLRGIPSWWLTQSEKSIDIKRVPTTSGLMSLTASRMGDQIRVSIDLPQLAAAKTIKLYFPLPPDQRLSRIEINGRPSNKLDSANRVVSFSGLAGRVNLVAFLA